MNETIFTVEEENFICIFDVGNRTALINEIRAAMQNFDEPELMEIAEITLKILDGMTDAEFSELSFNPAYFNDDDETEV